MTEWSRLKYSKRCPKALDHYIRLANDSETEGYPDAARCSGLVLCKQCGWQYYDHPSHPFISCLTVICDGEIVKL